MRKAQKKIEEKYAGKEVHIIKAINLLQDLDLSFNLLSEAQADWKRKSPEQSAEKEFNELGKNADALKEERKHLQEFIEKEMNLEMPNFTLLATPIIGAKMLSTAGSKKKLALIPGSTMQLLGAEKALFNHLKNKRKTKPPKHGHLFNHPLIQSLQREKRGKAARTLAGKLCIAARRDFFTGKLSVDTQKELDVLKKEFK